MYVLLYTIVWMIKLLLISNLMFCAYSHPIYQMSLLILSTMFVNLNITIQQKFSWISLIYLLLLIGGIMILFIYLVSLSPYKTYKIFYPLIIILPLIYFVPFSTNFSYSSNFKMNLSNLFNSWNSLSSIYLIFYLLFCLLVIMNLINNLKTPLRSNLF